MHRSHSKKSSIFIVFLRPFFRHVVATTTTVYLINRFLNSMCVRHVYGKLFRYKRSVRSLARDADNDIIIGQNIKRFTWDKCDSIVIESSAFRRPHCRDNNNILWWNVRRPTDDGIGDLDYRWHIFAANNFRIRFTISFTQLGHRCCSCGCCFDDFKTPV